MTSLLRRFWVYQAERFSLPVYSVLIAVLAAGGIGWSRAARQAQDAYSWAALGAAFVVTLGFFFQLRVADEYKDYAVDLAHRPYRPVPRGVIRLSELAWLALSVGVVQAVVSAWLAPRLLFFLLGVWGYMALMRWEFGIGSWLHRHPLVYMLSHMVVLPLIFAYIAACDWLRVDVGPPSGLGWLLATGYANGVVFEVGRKLRAPEDEEVGVETYSRLWGVGRAAGVWWAAIVLAGVAATLAARAAGDWGVMGPVMGVGATAAAALGIQFVRRPSKVTSARLEQMSALWMLVCYGALALLPLWAGRQ